MGCVARFPDVHLWPLLLNFSESGTDGTQVAGPVFTNVRQAGLVETGFLLGTNSTDADRVEVSIDGGAYSTATGTTNWSYALPTGSAIWRDDSVHTVAVRSVRGSLTSQTTSISLKKGRNRDVNGDGYPDLVVGAAGYNSSQGRVYVFHSSSTGITATAAAAANRILIGGCMGDIYGDSITQGDFNGDGYGDLAVGAYGAGCATQAGRVYVYQSAGTTGIPAAATTTIAGETNGDRLGSSLAAGDINGDGYADLVAGAERLDGGGTDRGRVYVFHSGASGITATDVTGAATSILGTSSFDELGSAAATGDFNGDGYADVAAGALRYNAGANQGRVYLFHSTGSGGITVTAAGSANGAIAGQFGNDDFSTSIATGDFNADRYTDLIVGANRYSAGGQTGRAYIFHSTGSGGITISAAGSATRIITGEAASDEFGARVATGDINGDGYADAVVSARSYSGGSAHGRFYLFHSSASGISTTLASAATRHITGGASYDQFSAFAPVLSTDLNGDGYADLICGAGNASTGGQVYVFHSSSSGIAAAATSSAVTTITSATGGEYFGDKITN